LKNKISKPSLALEGFNIEIIASPTTPVPIQEKSHNDGEILQEQEIPIEKEIPIESEFDADEMADAYDTDGDYDADELEV